MNNLPKLILRFPLWWYKFGPKLYFRLAKNSVLALDRRLAVSLMMRLWLTPLFGDPNLVGHLIAIIFRTSRILVGVLVIITAELILLTGFLLWLALPFMILSRFFAQAFLFILIIFAFYLRHFLDLPERRLANEDDLKEDPRHFLRPSLTAFILEAKDEIDLLNKILGRNVPKKLLMKLGFATSQGFLQEASQRVGKIRNVPLDVLLKEAQEIAWNLKDKKISSAHLLLVILKKMDFKYDDLFEVLHWSNEQYEREHPPAVWDEEYQSSGLGGFNRSWTGRVTYNLDKFGRDLTHEAQNGYLPPLIGKKEALVEAVRILERRSKNHVLLVGAPGCGKTTLVYGLAGEIVKGTNSPGLTDKRLVMLDLSKLQAGAKTAGELQERIHDVLDDIEHSGNVILFIDEIHNAVAGGGGSETSVIFGAFVQRMEAGRFQVIGATSWESYRKYVEPNTAFARLFERVEIAEATSQETLKILEYVSGELEVSEKVIVTLEAARAAIELSRRYIYDRVLPDKAVDLLEEGAAQVRRLKRIPPLVLKTDLEKLISEKTNIPIAQADARESAALLNLEEKIHARLINQSEAVTAVADAIRRSRVGLRDEKRPITSLLFVGPTGVGKTETAKALAEVFYGSEEKMARFDMSEFQADSSVESLIAKITDAIFHKPFSLVLFDEVEKASQKVLDIFLQVVDDGRLTDTTGKVASFANCLLVFTSNAGTSFIFENLRAGRGIDDFKKDLFKKLEEVFRIEFLNRFDGIIVYKPLSPEQIEMITRLKLKRISGDMGRQGYKINFGDSLIKKLAEQGYDPALGARPLRRIIQDKVEAILAKKILSGEIRKAEPFEFAEATLSVG